MPQLDVHNFQTFVSLKFKRDHASKAEQLLSAVNELCEEVGEVAGVIKKRLYYPTHSQDQYGRIALLDELSDAMACLFNVIDVCEEEASDVIKNAIAKINRKYPGGFGK